MLLLNIKIADCFFQNKTFINTCIPSPDHYQVNQRLLQVSLQAQHFSSHLGQLKLGYYDQITEMPHPLM